MTGLQIIVAVDEDGGIGKDGTIPWHHPEDLRRFKALTLGQAVIMGRRTWDSLPAKVRPLPGRVNIVLTRTHVVADGNAGFGMAGSLDAALTFRRDRDRFIIGGAEVYREAMPIATVLHLTRVPGRHGCDTFFPAIGPEWIETGRLSGGSDGLVFCEFARRTP